ncbi:MAG: glycosyltransferase family 2 protein [Flavobacteriales bacterium]|nr:glycosyltransferase family 2 protein [Flavobacteriales bacterium]
MKISVVVPSYNEESNVPLLASQLKEALSPLCDFEIIFVDDGSTDNTLQQLKELNDQDKRFRFVSFSRNFGHQHALRCGMDYAQGDCVISMDADLQHPVELVPEMISKWKEGYDVVYTQRIDEARITFFKKLTSGLFYRLMNWLSDVELEEGTADFRLMDKRATNVIRNAHEPNLFIRGFVSWMGFKQYKLTYKAAPRHSGKSKYSIRKMIGFALNGITSFSIKPLRFSIIAGLLISLFAFAYSMYAIVLYLFYPEKAVAGWASVLVSVLFMGGIQLLFLGVIGEYLGKLFLQSKNRPHYIVQACSSNE